MKIKTIIMTSLLVLGSVHTVLAVEETSEMPTANKEVTQEIVIPTEEQYLQNIAGVQEISSEKLVELLESGAEFNLFLGRKTCPHCRAFSAILRDSIPSLKREIYYINVENEMNHQALAFFQENKIGAVPTILFIAKGKIISGWIGEGLNAEQVVQVLNVPIPEENTEKEVTSEATDTKQSDTNNKEEVTSEIVDTTNSNVAHAQVINKKEDLTQHPQKILSDKININVSKSTENKEIKVNHNDNHVSEPINQIKLNKKVTTDVHLNKSQHLENQKILPKTTAIK